MGLNNDNINGEKLSQMNDVDPSQHNYYNSNTREHHMHQQNPHDNNVRLMDSRK